MQTRNNDHSKSGASAEGDTLSAAAAPFDDESLPELAAHDDARLLVQSPRRLFLYWSFALDPRPALRHAFGALAGQFEIGARLVELENDAGEAIICADGRSVWFDADPRRAYRADVGFFAEGLPFVRLLTSNVVQTPAETVSELPDDASDFQIEPADFRRLFMVSGFANVARTNASGVNVETQGADAASVLSPVSSFELSNFAPSSFVLGVAARRRRE